MTGKPGTARRKARAAGESDPAEGEVRRSKATPLVRDEEDEVPTAPLDDAHAVSRRLGGLAERHWEAMIKGLGKLIGIGDARPVEAESDDGAEVGPRIFHVSTCTADVPRDAHFLPFGRSGAVES